jgi:hypothetical protein
MHMVIKQVLTTAYHPQSHGMVEHVYRQIKDTLRKHSAGPECHSHLPLMLLGLLATPLLRHQQSWQQGRPLSSMARC